MAMSQITRGYMCEFVLKADPERARRAARQLPVPCCLFKSCGSKKYGSFAQPQTDGINVYPLVN